MAVAQARNLIRREPNLARAIVDDDEIVSRSVHFGKRNLHHWEG
jgi:hypothetical protein